MHFKAWSLHLSYLCRPKILELNGLRFGDYKNQEEALKIAGRLLEQNKAEFEHAGAVLEDPEIPLLSKYRYIISTGKKRTWAQSEKQELRANSNVKGLQQMRDAKGFMECLGEDDGASSSSNPVVVSQKWLDLENSGETLRTHALPLHTAPM